MQVLQAAPVTTVIIGLFSMSGSATTAAVSCRMRPLQRLIREPVTWHHTQQEVSFLR
jgi:hypothetical protein